MVVKKLICEHCGVEISVSNYSKHIRRHEKHPESFETPKYQIKHEGLNCSFCGKLCKNRNSLSNHERLCRLNPDKQASAIERYNISDHQVWNKGLTVESDERVKQHALSRKGREGTFKGKHHSDSAKQKLREARLNYLSRNPDKVPSLLNHSSKTSYPELYFSELFEIENIPLKHHKQISYYQLDFYNEECMLDIEIDGEQHYVDERIVESDKRRSRYLEDLGWTVFRIRWAEYQRMSLQEKQEVVDHIKKLIDMRR